MGEKFTPAAESMELLRVKALEEALERGTPPPVVAQVSARVPVSTPVRSNGSDMSLPLEKAYFEQIIENAPEAISIVDEEHRILRINAEFTQLFGFTAADVSGKTLDKVRQRKRRGF